MTMTALVTGGGGFLGGAIVRRLVERGDRVRSLARGHYPELEALGVVQHRGDLADADAVTKAATGCDIVFHVAAKAGVWGRYDEYHRHRERPRRVPGQRCDAARLHEFAERRLRWPRHGRRR
jgi:nucleoside-diphosphate-sugar epimerase